MKPQYLILWFGGTTKLNAQGTLMKPQYLRVLTVQWQVFDMMNVTILYDISLVLKMGT